MEVEQSNEIMNRDKDVEQGIKQNENEENIDRIDARSRYSNVEIVLDRVIEKALKR